MAVRKETIKQRFEQALPSVLEPGEQVRAGCYLVTGPSPFWVAGLFGVIGMLLMGVRYYYMAITDRRVLFSAASFWSGRPKGVAWADPRGAVAISDVVIDAKLWNHLLYARPGVEKPLRLNVHVWWREEMRAVLGALSELPPPPPG